MGLPKNSAFSEAEDMQDRLARKLETKVLPVTPTVTAAPSDGLNLEQLYSDLDRAAIRLEGGDISGAIELVEQSRDTVYTYLR